MKTPDSVLCLTREQLLVCMTSGRSLPVLQNTLLSKNDQYSDNWHW